jgi:nucleotide-binding universal stress UspA family protein
MLRAQDMLVAVDFSATSFNAIRVALKVAEPEGDVTLLHVIDEQFVGDAVAAGMGTSEEIVERVRQRAEAELEQALAGVETGGVNVARMIVVGVPFVEIPKIARDLDLPLIVMGVGGHKTPAEELIFGSTVEKVLRLTRVPVLCVPL